MDNALANYDEAKRALEAVEDSITNNGQDLQNAREELKKVTERWDKKVEKAEVDVAEKMCIRDRYQGVPDAIDRWQRGDCIARILHTKNRKPGGAFCCALSGCF